MVVARYSLLEATQRTHGGWTPHRTEDSVALEVATRATLLVLRERGVMTAPLRKQSDTLLTTMGGG